MKYCSEKNIDYLQRNQVRKFSQAIFPSVGTQKAILFLW